MAKALLNFSKRILPSPTGLQLGLVLKIRIFKYFTQSSAVAPAAFSQFFSLHLYVNF